MKAKIVFRDNVGSGYECLVSTSPSLAVPLRFGPVESDQYGIVRFSIEGLTPNTRYYAGLHQNGLPTSAPQCSFRTLPAGKAYSFDFMLASCANTGSTNSIFPSIVAEDPLFFIHMGDIHYRDETSTDPEDHIDNYDLALNASNQQDLYRNMPVWYMWDDHDYGPNDSDRTSPNRDASCEAFRRRVPLKDLVKSGITDEVFYKFEIGRVVFIMSDLRAERDPNNETDDENKTMMGFDQREWFKEELTKHPGKVICWMSSVPWVASSGSDTWASFQTERNIIANAIADAGVQDRFFVIAGDMHAVAVNDGTHSDYSDAQAGGFPVYQAAPLDRGNSTKGGPYTSGPFDNNNNQVGKIEITDNGGDTITVKFTGYEFTSGALSELTTHQFEAQL